MRMPFLLSSLSRTPMFGLAAALLAAGCSKGPAQPPPMPPPEVGVVSAHATTIPLVQELVGRLSAVRSADVRARVAGVLLKRVYTEGGDVKQGQVLFQIDPAPLRAALNAQLANLAAAASSVRAAGSSPWLQPCPCPLSRKPRQHTT